MGGNTGCSQVVCQLGIGTIAHGKHQRIGTGDGVDLAVLLVADSILGNLGHLGLSQHVDTLGEHARDEHRAAGTALVGGERLGHLDDGDIAIGRRQVVDQRGQVIGRLAADGAAAHDDDLLARKSLAAQQVVSRHNLLKALHEGRSDGLGAIS